MVGAMSEDAAEAIGSDATADDFAAFVRSRDHFGDYILAHNTTVWPRLLPLYQNSSLASDGPPPVGMNTYKVSGLQVQPV
jgi:hypothetical protein